MSIPEGTEPLLRGREGQRAVRSHSFFGEKTYRAAVFPARSREPIVPPAIR
jgi:hypothetical protein